MAGPTDETSRAGAAAGDIPFLEQGVVMGDDPSPEPDPRWETLHDDLRVALDFACGSTRTSNVDQSQIDVASELLSVRTPSKEQWAAGYKALDYFTRIIIPATIEGIKLENEAKRDHIERPAIYFFFGEWFTSRRSRRDAERMPYIQRYRAQTWLFCIFTLALFGFAVFCHSRVIPGQDLQQAKEVNQRDLLKAIDKLSMLQQATSLEAPVSGTPSGNGNGNAARAAIARDQVAALEGEVRDRAFDICVRDAYLKSWHLNQSFSNWSSWLPYSQTCPVLEADVQSFCNGKLPMVPCRGSWDPAAAGQPPREQSLAQTNEHLVHAHIETLIRIWLPALYGALGASLWVIRERYAQIREVRVSRTRALSRMSRLMLGAGAGSVIHMFHPLMSSVSQGYEALSLPAIAFIVGYNVEFAFALADEFIRRFTTNGK